MCMASSRSSITLRNIVVLPPFVMLSVAKHLGAHHERPFATLRVTRWGKPLDYVGACNSYSMVALSWPHSGDHPTPWRGQASPLLYLRIGLTGPSIVGATLVVALLRSHSDLALCIPTVIRQQRPSWPPGGGLPVNAGSTLNRPHPHPGRP